MPSSDFVDRFIFDYLTDKRAFNKALGIQSPRSRSQSPSSSRRTQWRNTVPWNSDKKISWDCSPEHDPLRKLLRRRLTSEGFSRDYEAAASRFDERRQEEILIMAQRVEFELAQQELAALRDVIAKEMKQLESLELSTRREIHKQSQRELKEIKTIMFADSLDLIQIAEFDARRALLKYGIVFMEKLKQSEIAARELILFDSSSFTEAPSSAGKRSETTKGNNRSTPNTSTFTPNRSVLPTETTASVPTSPPSSRVLLPTEASRDSNSPPNSSSPPAFLLQQRPPHTPSPNRNEPPRPQQRNNNGAVSTARVSISASQPSLADFDSIRSSASPPHTLNAAGFDRVDTKVHFENDNDNDDDDVAPHSPSCSPEARGDFKNRSKVAGDGIRSASSPSPHVQQRTNTDRERSESCAPPPPTAPSTPQKIGGGFDKTAATADLATTSVRSGLDEQQSTNVLSPMTPATDRGNHPKLSQHALSSFNDDATLNPSAGSEFPLHHNASVSTADTTVTVSNHHHNSQVGLKQEHGSANIEVTTATSSIHFSRLTDSAGEMLGGHVNHDEQTASGSMKNKNNNNSWHDSSAIVLSSNTTESLQRQQQQDYSGASAVDVGSSRTDPSFEFQEASQVHQRANRQGELVLMEDQLWQRARKSKKFFIGISLVEINVPKSSSDTNSQHSASTLGDDEDASTASANTTSSSIGLTVDAMYVGGPGTRAGIRLGDIIVAVAGVRVPTFEDFRVALHQYAVVGDLLPFIVIRQHDDAVASAGEENEPYEVMEFQVPVMTLDETFRPLGDDIFFEMLRSERIFRQQKEMPTT